MKVSPQQIKSLYRAMFAVGRSPSTVRRVAMVLHKAFEDARREGLVGQNPVDYSDPPQNARFEPRIWDEEQVRLFVGEVRRSSRFPEFWILMVGTGLRLGEGLATRVCDLDLNFGRLHVRRTLSRPRGGGWTFTPPKSKASRRIVALSPELIEILRPLRDRRTADGPEALLFVQSHGAPVRPKQVRADLRCIIEKAGVPGLRIHDLRHAYSGHHERPDHSTMIA